ncbi:MAG: hypothetical protein HOP16_18145 [Acidobacteria bacterium]|nr:hypothetical protein [Acidobacteriota bacterium]
MRQLQIAVLLIVGGLLGRVDAAAQVTETVIYYHTDAIGSVRMTTDATGAIVGRYDYLPFGEPCGPTCNPTAPPEVRQFGGKEKDLETGFDYFGARYHQSQTGRFTTVDPVLNIEKAIVDPEQWNRYTYSRNNPLRYVDPDGRAIETAWDLFNIGTGLASLAANVSVGNVPGALLDVGGLLLDTGATALPGLPGGVSSLIKARRLAENAANGRQFERAVIEHLGAVKNQSAVSEIATRVTTIPDLPMGSRFGVTDIKNVKNISLTKQLQAQAAAAQTGGYTFNLVVSTRTQHVSRRLLTEIEQSGGTISIYDPRLEKVTKAIIDGAGNVVRRETRP